MTCKVARERKQFIILPFPAGIAESEGLEARGGERALLCTVKKV